MIIPKKLKRYKYNPEQTVQRAKSRMKEPNFLYSLSTNSCEHLVLWSMFGISFSYQLDRNDIRVCILGIYALASAIQLAVVGFFPWTHSIWAQICLFREVCLACFQSHKFHNQKKCGYISHSCLQEHMVLIWTKAMLCLTFAFFAGWMPGSDESCLFRCSIGVGLAHVVGMLIEHLGYLKSVNKWILLVVGVVYCLSIISWLFPYIGGVVLWYIVVPLIQWLLKSPVVCFVLGLCYKFS